MDIGTTEHKVQAMLKAYDAADSSSLSSPRQSFAFATRYVYFTQFTVLQDETLFNLGLALLAIGVVSAFVLRRFWYVMLAMVMTLAIDVDLLGSLALWWNRSLNAITVIPVIMAVGLVIDYIAHIVSQAERERGGRGTRQG